MLKLKIGTMAQKNRGMGGTY